MDLKQMKMLLAGKADPDDEGTALQLMAVENPEQMAEAFKKLMTENRKFRGAASVARSKQKEAEEILKNTLVPPLHPATVIRVNPDERVDLICGSGRILVKALPDVAVAELRPGDAVYLDSDRAVIVARSEQQERAGLIGTVGEIFNEQVLVQGIGDEETVMLASPELVGTLESGDRVIYIRDFPCVIDRLPKRTRSQFELETAPDVTFDDIGGLDAIIDELRDYLDLHLSHPDLCDQYGLVLPRGVTLVGTPGVGKTMLAAAIANHLASGDRETRFLDVKPGALRGIYYGQAEARIRELFSVARNAPGLVVLFFDELDTYGARGPGIGQDIDGRVMGALLSELDGLEPSSNVFCVGATNRLDRCDSALVRSARLGDRIFRIPRPGRDATAQILTRYLPPELAYADSSADLLIEAATSYLHTPVGGIGAIATVVLQNGERREIQAADLLNGALLSTAVQNAKHVAARRDLRGNGVGNGAVTGLSLEDLLDAIDDAIAAETEKIATPHAARAVLEFSNSDEIAHVEVAESRRLVRHRHLRVA
jgi:proteasome-associated ATPase